MIFKIQITTFELFRSNKLLFWSHFLHIQTECILSFIYKIIKNYLSKPT